MSFGPCDFGINPVFNFSRIGEEKPSNSKGDS